MKKESKRTQYEYIVITLSGLTPEECALELTEKAGNGWECLGVLPPSGTDPARLVFGREKFDDK